jgi:hypothetical protein
VRDTGAVPPVTPVPEKTEVKKIETVPTKHELKVPERINFVILDGLSNGVNGVANTKKIARGIIESGGTGDAFIILRISPLIGLDYVIGPEKDKTKLLLTLDKIYQDPGWVRVVDSVKASIGSGYAGAELQQMTMHMSYLERNQIRRQYHHDLNRLKNALRDLKLAFKTIRLPKTVFFISGGVQQIIRPGKKNYYSQSSLYCRMLMQTSTTLNEGGGLLYAVNPIMKDSRVRKVSKFMAKVSNADINGDNVGDVLKKVKNNTAAYYELAFTPGPKFKERFQIKIVCKRDGVKLNSLRFGEKQKSYREMEVTQKKLFALNVVTGGSWSRIVGKVRGVRYQILEESKKGKNTIKKIGVVLPQMMIGRKADVFVLNVNLDTLDADIEWLPRVVSEKEIIEVKCEKGRAQYVVIVEPDKTYCIFTKI